MTVRLRIDTDTAQDDAFALIRMINASPGEYTLIGQAPPTNIACAVEADRSIAQKLKRLVIMGGSNNAPSNVTAAAEANFWHDPEAANTVSRAVGRDGDERRRQGGEPGDSVGA